MLCYVRFACIEELPLTENFSSVTRSGHLMLSHKVCRRTCSRTSEHFYAGITTAGASGGFHRQCGGI
jgi:hypothetical protein